MDTGFQRLRKIGPRPRSAIILAVDGLITVVSFMIAMVLRFDSQEIAYRLDRLPPILVLLVLCRLAWNRLLRLDRWSFTLSGLTDGARIAMAGVSGTALFVLALHLFGPGQAGQLGRAVLVLELLLSTALMAAVRFAPRLGLTYRADLLRGRRPEAVSTAIVGAGSAGEMLLRGLQRAEGHRYRVVGFIDDERGKHGQLVGGRTVLGAVADLPRLVERYGIRQILIAIPNLEARRVREILELSTHLKLGFKILPASYNDIDQNSAAMLQDLTPEDLLDREEVKFRQVSESSVVSEGLQMVVGAAGSIGSEVCAQILGAGAKRLVMVDIDENGLYMLKRRLDRDHPEASIIAEIGDIRDQARLELLFGQHRPADVFHAAARKHVPLMEAAPSEAVKTNVFGTLKLARIASESGVERFVYMSTDKAVRPVNVMGATKRLGEMLMQALAAESKTRFSVVRFGNVLGSSGSVVPLFREQIESGGPVTVTHPEVRRYFMTISEAVGLVLRAAYGDYGQLCVLKMGSQIRIAHLARLMITMSGRVPDIDVKISYIGLRPGERLAEELLAPGERVVHSIDSRIQVVEATAPPEGLLQQLGPLQVAAATEDHEAILQAMRDLMPDYKPLLPSRSGAFQVASEVAVM
ncbi:MAG: nucleoside-diphosphate sugar epimerase/dehydratase [Acidobacteriota bacterium]